MSVITRCHVTPNKQCVPTSNAATFASGAGRGFRRWERPMVVAGAPPLHALLMVLLLNSFR